MSSETAAATSPLTPPRPPRGGISHETSAEDTTLADAATPTTPPKAHARLVPSPKPPPPTPSDQSPCRSPPAIHNTPPPVAGDRAGDAARSLGAPRTKICTPPRYPEWSPSPNEEALDIDVELRDTTWKPAGGSDRKTQSILPVSSELVDAAAGTGATRPGAVANAQSVASIAPNALNNASLAPFPPPPSSIRAVSRRRPQPCSETRAPMATAPPTDEAIGGMTLSACPNPATTSSWLSETPLSPASSSPSEHTPSSEQRRVRTPPIRGRIAGTTHRASPPRHDDAATLLILPNSHVHAPNPADFNQLPAKVTKSPPASPTTPGRVERTDGLERTRAKTRALSLFTAVDLADVAGDDTDPSASGEPACAASDAFSVPASAQGATESTTGSDPPKVLPAFS